MRLSFLGACREVSGSSFLIETCGKKILLDCGFFQGIEYAEERNYAPFNFDPRSIDIVVIGHAHLDHTGRLPKLAKGGFSGKIYSTAPTRELAQLVLEDNFKLMTEEAERDRHEPLYEGDNVAKVMELFESLEYDKLLEISPGINLTLKNAGHILGSAITLIESEGKRLVYTSDLGNKPSILLNAPETVNLADVVICESTYGGRVHEDISKRVQKLSQIISTTVNNNSVLMIPSFAIERTQELLHDIDQFCTINGCTRPEFFLDSPLASKATAVFNKYPNFLNQKMQEAAKGDFLGLMRIKITASVEESKGINDFPAPKIIIAGAGMMNGGRILHHLMRYLPDSNNTLLIIGYQANGTLGRRIIDGAKQIRIFGKNVPVCANIVKIGSYSAHADMPQLIDWLAQIKKLKKAFIVHGDADQSLALAKSIDEKLKVDAIVPQTGESYEI